MTLAISVYFLFAAIVFGLLLYIAILIPFKTFQKPPSIKEIWKFHSEKGQRGDSLLVICTIFILSLFFPITFLFWLYTVSSES